MFAVMMDYWLAGFLGQAQLPLYRHSRGEAARLAEACRAIGRGGKLEGRDLASAQQFARAMWWRFALASLIVFGVGGGAASVMPRGPVHTFAFGVLLLLLTLMAIGSS